MYEAEKLIPYIEAYKRNLSEESAMWEVYKWDAVWNFQKNWDIDAPDFGEMFDRSLQPPNRNLWAGMHFLPRTIILEFCDDHAEEIRGMFRLLYDESLPLVDRLSGFKNEADRILVKTIPDKSWSNYQDKRAIVLYLALRYPEKYCLYKSEMFHKFCAETGFMEVPKRVSRTDFSDVLQYQQMCDEINRILVSDEELLRLHKTRLPEKAYQETSFKMLTQDFIYVVSSLDRLKIKGGRPLPSDSGLVEDGQSLNDLKFQALIRNIRKLGNNGICSDWMDQTRALLEAIDTDFQDDRVVLTAPSYGGFTLSVNNRYMSRLRIENGRIKIGVTVPQHFGLEGYNPDSIYRFKSGNKNSDSSPPPVYLLFDHDGFDLSDLHLQEARQKAILEELPSASISLLLKHKNPHLVRAILEPEFREEVFALAQDSSFVAEEPKIEIATSMKKIPLELNTILYGPPGSGKTYALKNEYFKYFTSASATQTPEEHIQSLTKDLTWWRTVVLALLDKQNSKVNEIYEHPYLQGKLKSFTGKDPRNLIWGCLQERTKQDCPNVNTAIRFQPQLFWKAEDGRWSVDEQIARSETPELISLLQQIRNFQPTPKPQERFLFTTFHQAYSYEDFIEGIKPVLDGSDGSGTDVQYEIQPGIFKRVARMAEDDPENDYALFIDEINRGNVANIFGELITLIEDDKRKGAENELTVILPYSKESFTVPPNLYIIATMNTADRSVEALDTALRRRFSFIEMPPRPELLQNHPDLEVDLPLLLQTINIRIERLLDKDHRIGHSYFMQIAESENPIEELKRTFANKIIPLLEEYFYGNPSKIGNILGPAFVKKVAEKEVKWPDGFKPDELEEKEVVRIANPLEFESEEPFRSIYE